MPDPLAILAQPRRARILQLVWNAERSAGAIAAEMPVTFGAVSQHLKVLLDAHLVVVRQDGRERYYLANKAALGPMAAALEEMWFGKLSELKRLAEAEQTRLDAANTGKSPARTRKRGTHRTAHARSNRRSKPE